MKRLTKILLLLIFIQTMLSCSNTQFNKSIWINDDPADYRDRGKMVNDLLNSKLLENKDASEIESILGEANWEDTTNGGRPSVIHYTVQLSYGFDIDPKYCKELIIVIDTISNKVSKLGISESKDRRNFIEKIFTQ